MYEFPKADRTVAQVERGGASTGGHREISETNVFKWFIAVRNHIDVSLFIIDRMNYPDIR